MNPGLERFLRYAALGVSTLIFDLALLYAVVTFFGVPYYIAMPGAFVIAETVNYAVSRKFVFMGTKRSWYGGYVYFILFIGAGAVATTSLVAALVSLTGAHFMLVRILVAGAVGIGNYVFNLFFNFKVAGQPYEQILPSTTAIKSGLR